MISYSAPGKIHLLGEHSVVYGKPALLSAINLRVKVSISAAKKSTKKPQLGQDMALLQKTIEQVIKRKFKIKQIPKYSVIINSNLPIGGGLGSSAASSAAYIACLLKFLKIAFDLKLVNELTYEAEKVFNGNPSGGDNTTIVYGGLIWYRKELEFLKTFSPLPFNINKKIKNFYLLNSGKPIETTALMVEKVKKKIGKQGSQVKNILDSQEQLVKDLALVLKAGDEDSLIEIIRKGEKNLESLGVVGKKAKKIIRAVENLGGAAKIIGGGGIQDGSGMLLCYFKNNNQREFFSDHELMTASLTTEGLSSEK